MVNGKGCRGKATLQTSPCNEQAIQGQPQQSIKASPVQRRRLYYVKQQCGGMVIYSTGRGVVSVLAGSIG